MINEWNVDLLLHIVQFLNASDMAKMSLQSRRWYYIVYLYRLNPRAQCVSVASYQPVRGNRQGTHYTSNEMYNRAIADLQSPPQLLLSFSSTELGLRQSPIHSVIRRRCPSDMVFLECVADKIQTSGIQHGSDASQQKPECKSQVALTAFAGLASNVKIVPFRMSPPHDGSTWDAESFVNEHFDSTLNWKLVILYVAGEFDVEANAFVRRVQAKFPHAVIVGGACKGAHVSVPIQKEALFPSVEFMVQRCQALYLRRYNELIGGDDIPDTTVSHEQVAAHVYKQLQRKKYEIKSICDFNFFSGGFCGVALAGDVPVQSVVSRGIERSAFAEGMPSIGSSAPASPTLASSFFIHEAVLRHDSLAIREENVSPYHLVRSICEGNSGKIIRGEDLIFRFEMSEYVGTQFPNENGFLLERSFQKILRTNEPSFAVTTRGGVQSLVGARVDFFSSSGGEESVADMECCMRELREQTNDDNVLGALMFICNERGPRPKRSFIPKEMSDAKCWARHFPNTPCTGFYAFGEFGPSPRAGRQSIVEPDNTCHKLEYSAVVLLFLAPTASSKAIKGIDDTDESIAAFVKAQLMKDTVPSRPAKRQHRESS